ncbi:hypothetical protein SAMN05443574_105248 [Haloarcula vallismortis]|uniref:DUF7310 domain-containing protein n=2 Tax=Haloarcula vallismortis TaxID=28442 RepID=M0JEN0_HALVA|nr:hypothetical protein [Haloarcula vallismortis]EMA06818.1 hypothetical protein C437_11958 [Haloarcula vallismortis ATCC 29715]SDW66382.1 hypothetical protein SAMN05443574_105248 [Haloarcula vallismortis]
MTDIETLAERLRTVERAVTDGTTEFPDVTELAELENRVDTVEQRVDDIDERTTELEAATQALRGYVGNVRTVNEDIEQRADAALAATDRLEDRLDATLSSPSVSGPQAAGSDQHRTGRAQAAPRSPDTVHADSSSATDFSAITEGSDHDNDETPDLGVVGRIRALL